MDADFIFPDRRAGVSLMQIPNQPSNYKEAASPGYASRQQAMIISIISAPISTASNRRNGYCGSSCLHKNLPCQRLATLSVGRSGARSDPLICHHNPLLWFAMVGSLAQREGGSQASYSAIAYSLDRSVLLQYFCSPALAIGHKPHRRV